MLGDELVDAYRALLAEVYDLLAVAGFPDLPQAATTVFRDIDGRGSLVSDLAVQAGMHVDEMWAVVRDLEAKGYVAIGDDRVRPTGRADEAFVAGRRALAQAEERLAREVGAEKLATCREVLRAMAAGRGIGAP
jgi:hypothetical protein